MKDEGAKDTLVKYPDGGFGGGERRALCCAFNPF